MSESPVTTQFLKTVSCAFYAKGNCTRGAGCGYAHSDDELRTVPNLIKTSLCKAWKVGSCRLGALQCPYAHGAKELKTTPYFLARQRELCEQKRKESMRTRDSTDKATQVCSKPSVQPQEPPMAKSMEDEGCEDSEVIAWPDTDDEQEGVVANFQISRHEGHPSYGSEASTSSILESSMETNSDSGDSVKTLSLDDMVKTQGPTLVGIVVFAPSVAIHPATVSNQANISLVQLIHALQLGAVGPMNEDHALAQRLVEAMPQSYED
jgi:hypothetical protein